MLRAIFRIVLAQLVTVGVACADDASAAAKAMILINRKERILLALDDSDKVILTAPVGIGRGGLKEKKTMSDYVTPTGEFTVDLVLYKDPSFNEIDKGLRERYLEDPRYADLVRDQSGLGKLFENMLSLDFDRDGARDRAYGDAYIGLSSPTAVTGPKMRFFGDTPYWFSIALHGTPTPDKDIGAANSGGCIHVRSTSLDQLVQRKLVRIGSRVIIRD